MKKTKEQKKKQIKDKATEIKSIDSQLETRRKQDFKQSKVETHH